MLLNKTQYLIFFGNIQPKCGIICYQIIIQLKIVFKILFTIFLEFSMRVYHLNAAVMIWKISYLFMVFLWQFPLPYVVLYATHQENKRLFGFVLRTSGGRSESSLSSVCYIFESNNEGEKVPGFQNVCFIKTYQSHTFNLEFLEKALRLCLVQQSCLMKARCSGESPSDEWSLSGSVSC